MPVEKKKEKKKGLKVSNFALLMVIFKLHHSSEGVNMYLLYYVCLKQFFVLWVLKVQCVLLSDMMWYTWIKFLWWDNKIILNPEGWNVCGCWQGHLETQAVQPLKLFVAWSGWTLWSSCHATGVPRYRNCKWPQSRRTMSLFTEVPHYKTRGKCPLVLWIETYDFLFLCLFFFCFFT